MKKIVKESVDETEYLLSSPANARHLAKGIAQLNKTRGLEKELMQIDENEKNAADESDKAL